MLNDKELVLFNEKYATQFKQLAEMIKAKKAIEESEKEVRKQLEDAFEKYGITKLDNPHLKISFIKATETLSVDLKTFQAAEPEEYKALLADYPKVTKRKAYVKFEAK